MNKFSRRIGNYYMTSTFSRVCQNTSDNCMHNEYLLPNCICGFLKGKIFHWKKSSITHEAYRVHSCCVSIIKIIFLLLYCQHYSNVTSYQCKCIVLFLVISIYFNSPYWILQVLNFLRCRLHKIRSLKRWFKNLI